MRAPYPGVEEVVLAVTVGNELAHRLYVAAGFKPYCIEPRYIKLDDQYFDIEWMVLLLDQASVPTGRMADT